MCDVEDGSAIVPSPPFGRTTPASRRPHPAQRPHGRGLAPFRVSFPISYEHSCEAEGGRDDRGVPDHAESTLSRAHKCSSRGVRFFLFLLFRHRPGPEPHPQPTCARHMHMHACACACTCHADVGTRENGTARLEGTGRARVTLFFDSQLAAWPSSS